MASRYEHDFHDWTRQQAELLRRGRFEELDVEHLIEEIEGMGASERRQLASRLKVLLAHLLKWQFQPHLRSRSWRATIKERRLSLSELLGENPSLRSGLPEAVATAYRHAVLLAVRETDLDEEVFPSRCPFSIRQIVAEAFFPADPAGRD